MAQIMVVYDYRTSTGRALMRNVIVSDSKVLEDITIYHAKALDDRLS